MEITFTKRNQEELEKNLEEAMKNPKFQNLVKRLGWSKEEVLSRTTKLQDTLDELQNDETFIAWSRDSMHNAPPEGEDGLTFIRRVIKGLDDVFKDMMANVVHNAALVIPGGMIMSMLALMGFPRHPMGEWECDAGAGYTIVMTPELWSRDKVFEVLNAIPMKPEDWEDHWSTKKYYEDGEEMFFE